MSKLLEFLKKEGPQISQQILPNWGKPAQSEEAKRKSLERAIKAESSIGRLKGVWSNNASFIYLNEQYKTPKFYKNIVECFSIYSSACYSIYHALDLHGGRLAKSELYAYCSCPIEKLKGQKLLGDYIDFLLSIGLIFDNDETYDLNPYVSTPRPSKGYAVGLSKRILMANFDDWASKINFQAWNSSEYFGEFAKFSWGHKCPSYIPGIRRNGNSPGFLIADFLIGQPEYYPNDIDFFLKKVDTISRINGFPSFMPFLICDSKFSTSAFSELKKRGIVACTTKSLFGKEYAKALTSIFDSIFSISYSISNEPDKLVELLSKIEKLIDGKTNNLRGDLFELAVALYFSQDHNNVMINQLVFSNGKNKEIDVKAETSAAIFFSECKFLKSPIKLEVVKKWLEEKVPVMKDWYKDKEQGNAKRMHFEFWSVSGFEQDALDYLSEQKGKIKKFELSFYDKAQILQKAYDIKFFKFKDIFKEYSDV